MPGYCPGTQMETNDNCNRKIIFMYVQMQSLSILYFLRKDSLPLNMGTPNWIF